MVTVNVEEYYKEYQDIYKTCIKDGVCFPVKLVQIILPKEYRFKYNEKQKIDGQLTKKNLEKIKTEYINRRRKERELIKKYSDDLESLEKSYQKEMDKELTDFVKKYPNYKKIIE